MVGHPHSSLTRRKDASTTSDLASFSRPRIVLLQRHSNLPNHSHLVVGLLTETDYLPIPRETSY